MRLQILTTISLLLGTHVGVLAAPPPSILETRKASPQCWYGNSFPAESDWLSFDALFEKWRPQFQAQGDTEDELRTMKNALQTYSKRGGFNPAFATAMMIQESQGNTCRVCGDGGVSCGLLQVHGAPSDCANKAHPCPNSTIQKGIECGTVGCAGATGSNIKSCVASQGTQWGAVLRCYNSGSVKDPSNLRVASPGDPRYVNLIANILLGADYAKIDQLGGAQCGFK